MATAKKLAAQMKNMEEEILNKEKILQDLKQKHRLQADKELTHSRIERAKMLENLIEDSGIFTDEQIKTFLEKTIQTNFARKILTEIREQNTAESDAKQEDMQSEGSENTVEKSETEQLTLAES